MKFGWRGALGILVSVACLVYVFHDINWPDTMARVRQANYGLLVLAALAATLMFPLRARRWRTILDPIVPRIPFGPLWRSVAIGMMVNNVVPMRAGELARAYAITREVPQVTLSTALASLVVDRVFDAVVVLALMAIATLLPTFPSGAGGLVGHTAIVITVAATATLIVGLYGMVFFPKTLIRIFEMIARRVSPRLEERGRVALHAFAEGLSVLRKPVHFLAVLWWTVLHWMLQPLAFWIGFKAVGIDVPFSAALFVQGLIVIGVSVPSTPGYFGPFELAAVAALGVYGVGAGAARVWAVAFHIVSFIPITLFGAYYFARLGLSMDDIGSVTRDEDAAQ